MLAQCLAEPIYVGKMLVCCLGISIQIVWHPPNKEQKVTIVVEVFKNLFFLYTEVKKKKPHSISQTGSLVTDLG